MKKSLLGCGTVIGAMVVAILLFVIFSGPGKAPAHPFDDFTMDGEACIAAFDGKDTLGFDHIWVLRSPDLQAWWGPNGMRADAELILDSDDRRLISELLGTVGASSKSPNHVRTLSQGIIYHVLLFSPARSAYAHLRFDYRSEQRDGSTTFFVSTYFNGAKPVKDCPEFSKFVSSFLLKQPLKSEQK